MYHMDLRAGMDPKHLNSINSGTLNEYKRALDANSHHGYFLTIKRRITGRAHDLLDAYRLEHWKRKLKKR